MTKKRSRKVRTLFSIFMIFVLLFGLSLPASGAQQANTNWQTAKEASLDWLYSNITPGPAVGSVGGEWSVIALARAGHVSADDPWVRAYIRDLNRTIREVNGLTRQGHNVNRPPSAGTFPSALRRWTDFQRVTLALTALGLDASDYLSQDLTAIFSTYTSISRRHSLNQTISADIFALIALNSNAYHGNREPFIQSILNAQRTNGTWGLGTTPTAMDVDTTAMAIQALAPYYGSNTDVTAAVDLALTWLRRQTFSNPEGTAQMIVALSALGPDFADEAESYVNILLRWFNPRTGGFGRGGQNAANDPVNMMATEQAAYALVAFYRLVNDMTSLYDMSDAFGSGGGA